MSIKHVYNYVHSKASVHRMKTLRVSCWRSTDEKPTCTSEEGQIAPQPPSSCLTQQRKLSLHKIKQIFRVIFAQRLHNIAPTKGQPLFTSTVPTLLHCQLRNKSPLKRGVEHSSTCDPLPQHNRPSCFLNNFQSHSTFTVI